MGRLGEMSAARDQDVRLGIITNFHLHWLGGMEMATHYLATALSRLPKTSVCLACNNTPREIPRNFTYDYPVYRARSLSRLTPFLQRYNVREMLKREQVNVLLTPNLDFGAKAVALAKKAGLPIIAVSHSVDKLRLSGKDNLSPSTPEKEARLLFSVRNADHFVAVSHLVEEDLRSLGVARDRISVVPNGCPHLEIGSIPPEDIRGRYGFDPDCFVLITVGNYRPVKRMDLLFEALALLKEKAPRIRCLCVGPGEGMSEAVAFYGLEKIVVVTGQIPVSRDLPNAMPPFPELINLYRAADLFVSVSYVESFNMSALDALACGVPILVSGQQGVRDVMVEGRTGFTLADQTPEALASMLVDLSRKREELRGVREAIRQSVSHLSWDHVAVRFRDLCASLLA